MKPSEPVQKRYDLLGPRVVKALESRHFEAYYVSTGSEAADLVEKLIPAGNTVGWGGSTTMNELGILDRVKKSHECIDRSLAKDPEEKKAIMKQALTADTFLMSSNAVSEDGILVNIDGVGNRVAALAYGPDQVIVVAGMNKVAKSLDDAVSRARNIAAPINMQRFGLESTPCSVTGACGNCKSTDSVCSQFVITRLCRPVGRIKVILVGEELGF
ncbi:MAG: lactate utilization protein [Anaerovoracaceae bacterium]|nr:lactate utilization protein [Bacillota bacterium]MDY2670391.1 lactate utilization protein [Anaerovoracaceae bacterium]